MGELVGRGGLGLAMLLGMSAAHALANAPFMECLPIGMTVLDERFHVAYLNRWMREHLAAQVIPNQLSDLAVWGDDAWGRFVESVRTMPMRVQGDFWLRIGPGNSGMQVTVSFHRMNVPLEGTIVMVVSDVSALRMTEEKLRESLSQVTELSEMALSQARELKRMNSALEERVRQRTMDLRRSNMDALRMLAEACEAKDHETGEHVVRVQRYTELLAGELGFATDQAHEFGYSAILHDVGKVHIPDAILNKPGPLTDEERAVMKGHPIAGEHILGGNTFFSTARRIARHHHENWDGSGYPDGLSKYGINIEARIVHVADVFDALVSRRPYKAAWKPEQALGTIGDLAGKSFDPEITAALESLAARGVLAAKPAA